MPIEFTKGSNSNFPKEPTASEVVTPQPVSEAADEFANYIHFKLVDGVPKLVDGNLYDKDILISSVAKILDNKDVSWSSSNDKQAFVVKACKAFGIPSSIASKVPAEEVVDIVKDTQTVLDMAKKVDESCPTPAVSTMTVEDHDSFIKELGTLPDSGDDGDDDPGDDNEV